MVNKLKVTELDSWSKKYDTTAKKRNRKTGHLPAAQNYNSQLFIKENQKIRKQTVTYGIFHLTDQNNRHLHRTPSLLGCSDCFYTETGLLHTARSHLDEYTHAYNGVNFISHQLTSSISNYSQCQKQNLATQNYKICHAFYAVVKVYHKKMIAFSVTGSRKDMQTNNHWKGRINTHRHKCFI